ncbi:MAG: hypothetical protein F2667_00570 [Actinobacteria bacterium]|uniref:Unannotated protein n=1 Tax=freshwater metagenome TaxID=449393 RepID=A0A6J6NH11_9ZZZZ|nr:hypothetical protein [Actinomycetota bacterium]
MTITALPALRLPFAFSAAYRLPGLLFAITPATTWVEVGEDGLDVRFGPWRLRTPLSNVVSVERSGGFAWWRTAGPARLSLSDRGVTFATNRDDAVCLTFREPVVAIDPTGTIRHRAATITVADVDGLIAMLARRTLN